MNYIKQNSISRIEGELITLLSKDWWVFDNKSIQMEESNKDQDQSLHDS